MVAWQRAALLAVHALYLAVAWLAAAVSVLLARVRRAGRGCEPPPSCPEHVWLVLRGGKCAPPSAAARARGGDGAHDLFALARLSAVLARAGARVITLCAEDEPAGAHADGTLAADAELAIELAALVRASLGDGDSGSGAGDGSAVARPTRPVRHWVSAWADGERCGRPRCVVGPAPACAQPAAPARRRAHALPPPGVARADEGAGARTNEGVGTHDDETAGAEPCALRAGELRLVLVSADSGKADVLAATRALCARAAASAEGAVSVAAFEHALSGAHGAFARPSLLLAFPAERGGVAGRRRAGWASALAAPLLRLRGLHPYHMALTELQAMGAPPSQTTADDLGRALARFARVTQRHGA
jgi:hypothetical protein